MNADTNNTRTCGGCTKCCDGWLIADIKEQNFDIKLHFGKPCQYRNDKGCGIHDQRPNGCRGYFCKWIKDPNLPDWMRPDKSNILLHDYDHVKFNEDHTRKVFEICKNNLADSKKAFLLSQYILDNYRKNIMFLEESRYKFIDNNWSYY